ncbi:MAG TPA: aminotransferase class V-fold PLP-dependent enzyme [Candidatus Binatia bacterium]|nr:aminotransferase class V-fold PLP-dependent enzyme [Candidatus Binatia bacterium]
MTYQPGWHFLQVPGPSNVPQRVMRAVDMPTIDHRGPEFAKMTLGLFDGLKRLFKTSTGEVVIYASSGSGAWEAAIENALSAGDKVLMFETGQFATLWHQMAGRLGLDAEFVPGDWRHPIDPSIVEARLSEDRAHKIKAVMVVHNETSTGVMSDIVAIRKAIDAAHHPAMFMVDTVSSLASIDYRHDEWGVDVTVAGSQKGLMLPPGLGFNAISKKALAAAEKSGGRRSYFSWADQLAQNRDGFFPQTPATNILYGLRESLKMLDEEGLENVFARHIRHGEATRRAVKAWGLELQCVDPAACSPTVTTIRVPAGQDADAFRATVLEHFNMSLGAGLGKVKGQVFRIGHLGDFNDLMLAGALSGVQMGLGVHGIPYNDDGVNVALAYLGNAAKSAGKPLAYA